MSHRNSSKFLSFLPMVVISLVILGGLATSFAVAWTSVATGRGSLKFIVPPSEPVAMHISYSSHYQVGTAEGVAEFANLVPSGGHLVHIDDDSSPSVAKPYTVTLFHQMKCLDFLRKQYISESSSILPFTKHCLDYLRQTLLCRPNLRIESAKNIQGTASRTYDAACNDWTRVYDEAEKNQALFAKRSGL